MRKIIKIYDKDNNSQIVKGISELRKAINVSSKEATEAYYKKGVTKLNGYIFFSIND